MTTFDNLSDEEFAAALMRGDPEDFKAGYTHENAVKAVCEQRTVGNVYELTVWARGYEAGIRAPRVRPGTGDTLESGLEILEEHLDEYEDEDRKALEGNIRRARAALAAL